MKDYVVRCIQDKLQDHAINMKTVEPTDILHNGQGFGLDCRFPGWGNIKASVTSGFLALWHGAIYWVDARVLSSIDVRLLFPKIITGVH
jgi:hypothetical protein